MGRKKEVKPLFVICVSMGDDEPVEIEVPEHFELTVSMVNKKWDDKEMHEAVTMEGYEYVDQKGTLALEVTVEDAMDKTRFETTLESRMK